MVLGEALMLEKTLLSSAQHPMREPRSGRRLERALVLREKRVSR